MTDLVAANHESTLLHDRRAYVEPEQPLPVAAEAEAEYLTPDQMRKRIDQLRRQMQEAAKKLDFITAAQLRDQMLSLMAQV